MRHSICQWVARKAEATEKNETHGAEPFDFFFPRPLEGIYVIVCDTIKDEMPRAERWRIVT